MEEDVFNIYSLEPLLNLYIYIKREEAENIDVEEEEAEMNWKVKAP